MAAAVAQHTETGKAFCEGSGMLPSFFVLMRVFPFLFLGKPMKGKWGIRKRERNGNNS